MHRHQLLVFIIAASVASAIGCSGQNASTTATSPSTRSADAPPPTSANATAATISGTVVGVSTTSGLAAFGMSLTVTVTGTASTSTVDSSGHFMLNNVPPGRVDLHFVGNGIDAHLGLDVAERATLVIRVSVRGNDAHLEDDRDDRGEIEGRINVGSLTGSCAAHNLSFMVGATKVVTNASTQFKDTRCEALQGNTKVEVKGTRQGDGSILATSVEGDDDEDDDRNEVELKGPIAAGSIAGSCAANTLSFKIGSTVVQTNAATQFKDAACSALKVGDSVEVKGTRQADGSVLAARVERKK
jgi:Domain of unknown function (DUF5666)